MQDHTDSRILPDMATYNDVRIAFSRMLVMFCDDPKIWVQHPKKETKTKRWFTVRQALAACCIHHNEMQLAEQYMTRAIMQLALRTGLGNRIDDVRRIDFLPDVLNMLRRCIELVDADMGNKTETLFE